MNERDIPCICNQGGIDVDSSKEELSKICPEEVGEFISEVVLPEYADGVRTSEMIANAMVSDAMERLEINSVDHLEYYRLHPSTALIDPFIVEINNKEIIIAYIQTVFDGWAIEYP